MKKYLLLALLVIPNFAQAYIIDYSCSFNIIDIVTNKLIYQNSFELWPGKEMHRIGKIDGEMVDVKIKTMNNGYVFFGMYLVDGKGKTGPLLLSAIVKDFDKKKLSSFNYMGAKSTQKLQVNCIK